MSEHHTVYIALGSNIGDRQGLLIAAIRELRAHVAVAQLSSVYETEPAYHHDQPRFLNLVLRGHTALTPHALLHVLKLLEHQLGRQPTFRNGPRPIDLDILLYDDLHFEDEHLVIPHPRMCERPFVLVPLAEIAPDLVPPGCHGSVSALAQRLHAGADGGIVHQRGAVALGP